MSRNSREPGSSQQRRRAFSDDDVPDDFVLPDGDVERGRILFKKHCAQCHCINQYNIQASGCTLLGPSLYGLYGRTAGAQPRNSLLPSSPTMKESGVVWTDITLMRYLKNPRAFAEHAISMNFRGLSEWQDRVDLIWYIKAACHQDWLPQHTRPLEEVFKVREEDRGK
ncbi:cytochrome C family protein [Toxoplasma gondii GAB2-2007-GAL-DOM2]|uniref:Cytochrome C, putative n=3 Tax=Toxoplasma gondii TaxID=5811 RepID=A0A0F7V4R7_TOXGV|nr:cytochrome C family protein [Toxoplasma gondii GAB2-2007-GAL-DOM2]KFH02595.1 cytochrome C family protein [Toxoplasma gondii VAND]CEL76207.1 TPA: Cytochrome C, putative [Toxoplasma gondii VEG]